MRFLTTRSSPNFDERNGQKPEVIIVHYTSMKSTEAVLEKFADRDSKVSSHYLIDEKGNIYYLVDEEKRAWHAGESQWMGRSDVNSFSIGIEISNRNGQPYTKEQLFSLTMLCKDIMQRRGIPPENIAGHSDVAPHRKQDPGEHFPWEKMARHGIGRWPRPTIKDKFNAAAVARDEDQLKALLQEAGYGVAVFGERPALAETVTAFQRRYEPEAFNTAAKTPGAKMPGRATAATVAKLRAVARMNRHAQAKPPKTSNPAA